MLSSLVKSHTVWRVARTSKLLTIHTFQALAPIGQNKDRNTSKTVIDTKKTTNDKTNPTIELKFYPNDTRNNYTQGQTHPL